MVWSITNKDLLENTSNKDIAYDYVSSQPYYLFYICLYSICIFLGIIGNLFTILTIILVKELHNWTYIFVLNLAFIDFLLSIIVDLFSILGVFLGPIYFFERIELCRWIAATCIILCFGSMINIAFLASNRYVHICHSKYYDKLYDKKKIVLYIILIWVLAFITDIPNIVGWGGHSFDYKTHSCIWNRLASHSYSIFMPLTSIVLPCICVLIFYIKIFMYVSNSNKRTKQIDNNALSKSALKKSFKIAKSLFTSYLTFVICWIPYGFVILLDRGDVLPAWCYSFSALMVHAYSAINPFTYVIFNPALRKGYKAVLGKIVGIEVLNNKVSATTGNSIALKTNIRTKAVINN